MFLFTKETMQYIITQHYSGFIAEGSHFISSYFLLPSYFLCLSLSLCVSDSLHLPLWHTHPFSIPFRVVTLDM